MKKYYVVMAVLFLLSSCGRKSDHAVNLNRETETVSFEVQENIPVIINKASMTFHLDAECPYLSRLKDENRMELLVETPSELLSYGYKPCGRCSEEKDSQNNILP